MALLLGCGSSGSSSMPDASVAPTPDAESGGEGGEGGMGGTMRGGNSGRDAGPRPDRMSSGGSTGGDTGGTAGGSGGAGQGGVPGTGGSAGGSGGSTGGSGGGTGGAGGGGGAPAGVGTCEKPVEIPPTTNRVDMMVTTVGAPKTFTFACTGANTADTVLSFTLTQRELVYVDTFGSSINTVLYLADDACGPGLTPVQPGLVTCNDDACGTPQSQVVSILGYGRHYLVVSSAGSNGTVNVHFQRVPLGNGPIGMLSPGMATVSGTTSGQGARNACEAAGPDNSYWWLSCPAYAGGAFSATTCGNAMFDTILSLQVPRTDISQCADDDMACGTQSTLSSTIPPGAGIHVLTVDSSTASNNGAYKVNVTRP